MPYLRKTGFYFLLVMTLGISGCKTPPKQKQLPNVTVAKVEQRDVPIYVDAIGQAISTVTISIRPLVSGTLTATYIKQGDIVKEGDVIYTIDPRPYQAALDEANAQLEHDMAVWALAQQTVTSYKPIVDKDFISSLTFDSYISNEQAARAQVEFDKAAVRAAALNLEYCSVVATVSGKVSYFVVDVGNVVAVDNATAFTTIKPFSPIDILFSIPQQQLELIRAVQGNKGEWKFIAVLPEYPDKKYEGTTYFIDNQVNQDTGTILLKGRINNDNWEFWPGEFVKVQVLHRMAPNAFVVPPGAVLIGKDGPYLYLVDAEGKAAVHNVTVLIRTDEYIAIDSKDLHAGDTVIVDGQINISPGMKVNVLDDSKKVKA